MKAQARKSGQTPELAEHHQTDANTQAALKKVSI